MWGTQGLKKLGDLFKGQILLSFQQLQQQLALRNQGDFYRYLQIRDVTAKDTTLMTNNTILCVEKAPSLQIGKKCITVFYRALNSSSLTSQTAKQAWEKDLGVAIDDAVWWEVWSQVMNTV